MPKASEELLAMRELLAGPGAWTQGEKARMSNGWGTPYWDPLAVCFCLQGASFRVAASAEADAYISREIKVHGFHAWWPWNDVKERTHLEVVEMIERAAVAAMREESKL
jgi:hypothetical protein